MDEAMKPIHPAFPFRFLLTLATGVAIGGVLGLTFRGWLG